MSSEYRAALRVERVGFTTLQDLGRPGWAHLGVPHSGAADHASHRLANRLAGNLPTAATFETSGGLVLHALRDLVVVLAGAECDAFVDDAPLERCRATRIRAGQRVRVDRVRAGVRSYLAVSGGIDCPKLLGSRSHDALSAIVPQTLNDGAQLTVGDPHEQPHSLDLPIGPSHTSRIRLTKGPHAELFVPELLEQLPRTTWTASHESNRIGVRLTARTAGETVFADLLKRSSLGELDSMALVRGAVQLTPSGELVVTLADHPTTGGYPVIAVVHADNVDQSAQCEPGGEVRLSWAD